MSALDAVRSLLDGPAAATLTTRRADGTPFTRPVWFRFDGVWFEIVIAEGDAKPEHLRRHPRCTLLVFETVRPFRGVDVTAIAELVEGDVTDVRRDIAERYLGPEGGERFAANRRKPGVVVRHAADAARVWDPSATISD